MTDNESIAVGVVYAGIACVITGILLGINAKKKIPSSLADVLVAFIWPVSLLLALGFAMAYNKDD